MPANRQIERRLTRVAAGTQFLSIVLETASAVALRAPRSVSIESSGYISCIRCHLCILIRTIN